MPVTQRVSNKKGKRQVRFQAEVYVRGVRVACKSFPTKASAHVWHEETKRKIELGQDDPSSFKTFGDVVEEYKITAFLELRKSSQQARAARFRYLEHSPMAGVTMKEFGSRVIDEWLHWLKTDETTSNRNRRSFEQELKLLSVILNWYRNECDHKFSSPIVKRHYKGIFFKPLPMRQQDYYMRPDDVIRWLKSLEGRSDRVYYRLALLMVLTGLRMGEAAGLCWDALDLSDDRTSCIRVIRTLSWDYRTKDPYFQEEVKTDASVRTVKIEGAVLNMLRELKEGSKTSIGKAPVFLTNRGQLLRDNTIRNNFNAAFESCRLPWSGTHIARHTFATLALISERDIAIVQAALGHTSHKVTEGYAKIVALQSSKVTSGVATLIGLSNAPKSYKEVATPC